MARIESRRDDTGTTIWLSGSFGSSDGDDFRGVIREVTHDNGRTIVVDMSGLTAIEPAGMGLLMMLRGAALSKHNKVALRGAQGQVEKMLSFAKMTDLFDSRD
jgi:stage II sporulation protein AA (anti-sigma F factor antagonist)